LSFCQLNARSSSIMAPMVPLLAVVHPSLPLVIFGMVAASSAVSVLLLPETKGLELQDI